MAFEFENPDVKAKYVPARESDGKVHVPSGKVYGSGFAGPLSKIHLVAADKAFASGSNFLKLREDAPPVPPAKASANGKKNETEKPTS